MVVHCLSEDDDHPPNWKKYSLMITGRKTRPLMVSMQLSYNLLVNLLSVRAQRRRPAQAKVVFWSPNWLPAFTEACFFSLSKPINKDDWASLSSNDMFFLENLIFSRSVFYGLAPHGYQLAWAE
jgi:hypothetical protein